MAFEHKEGGMSIFKNEHKEKESQPDYTGSAKIDGKEKKISCWINEGKNGKYFSCKVQDPYVNPSNNTSAQQSAINNNFDDNIPF